MKKIIISATVIAALFSFSNCKENAEKKVLTKEVTFTKEGTLSLKKSTNDSIVAKLDIEIADDGYQTETGLMYRKSMERNHGMLFIFEEERQRSFYMKNTEFAIDIIYINSAKEVVNVQKNAKPFDPTSLPSDGPVLYVLEVNAGLSDLWNLEKGDVVDWKKTN
jgi:hypothetical protein